MVHSWYPLYYEESNGWDWLYDLRFKILYPNIPDFDRFLVENSNHFSTVKLALEILSRDFPLEWPILSLKTLWVAIRWHVVIVLNCGLLMILQRFYARPYFRLSGGWTSILDNWATGHTLTKMSRKSLIFTQIWIESAFFCTSTCVLSFENQIFFSKILEILGNPRDAFKIKQYRKLWYCD